MWWFLAGMVLTGLFWGSRRRTIVQNYNETYVDADSDGGGGYNCDCDDGDGYDTDTRTRSPGQVTNGETIDARLD